jgi:hypothetical protein
MHVDEVGGELLENDSTTPYKTPPTQTPCPQFYRELILSAPLILIISTSTTLLKGLIVQIGRIIL